MNKAKISSLKKDLRKTASKEKAEVLQRFFKTGPGEYGEGDVFIGVKVPEMREVAKYYLDLDLISIEKILASSVHEERLTALLIMVLKFKVSDNDGKRKIFRLYLENTRYINNWDLVDLSANHIIGEYLIDKDKTLLYKLAGSRGLWERRIAMLSTFQFIKEGLFSEAFNIARILLRDEHDLIQKAVGWMLREIGKRDINAEERFLKKHYKKMPRTMLRYAIERFPERKRLSYLKGKV